MPSVILEAGKLSVGEHLMPAESMAIRRRRFTFFIVDWVDFYVGLLKYVGIKIIVLGQMIFIVSD